MVSFLVETSIERQDSPTSEAESSQSNMEVWTYVDIILFEILVMETLYQGVVQLALDADGRDTYKLYKLVKKDIP